MQPDQPNQPTQPTPEQQANTSQPAPVQPVPQPEQQPAPQPAAAPQPVMQQPSPQPVAQPAFGTQPQPIASDVQKQIRNAGTSVFALGIFFAVFFSLALVIGLLASLSNAGEGIIMALMSALYVLFGVVLITQGKKLKAETDHTKAAGMMKSMAIGLSVLSVVALLGGAWLAIVLFVVTAIYLFVTSSKVAKG